VLASPVETEVEQSRPAPVTSIVREMHEVAQARSALNALDRPTGEQVFAATECLWKDLSWLRRFTEGLLRRSMQDLNFSSGIGDPVGLADSLFSGVTILDHALAKVSVGVANPYEFRAHAAAKRDGRIVRFSGKTVLSRFECAAPVTLQLWSCTPFTNDTDVVNDVRCSKGDIRTVSTGESIITDGTKDSISFLDIPAPLVLVQVQISDKICGSSLNVHLDSLTGKFVRVVPSDQMGSRVRVYAAALRALECDARTEALAAYLDLSDFFVRWQVMREIVSAQGVASVPLLERFLDNEVNPIARRAAVATHDMLIKQTRKEAQTCQ
jgi:hypothetical protein